MISIVMRVNTVQAETNYSVTTQLSESSRQLCFYVFFGDLHTWTKSVMGGSEGGRCRIIFSHMMQRELDNLIELVSVGLLSGHGIEPKYFLRPPKKW